MAQQQFLPSWRRAEKKKKKKAELKGGVSTGWRRAFATRETGGWGESLGGLGLRQLRLDTFTQETVAGGAVCCVHKHCFSTSVAAGCYSPHYCRASGNVHACCRKTRRWIKKKWQTSERHYYFWEYKSLAFFREAFSSITSQSRIMGFCTWLLDKSNLSFFPMSKYTCEPRRLSCQVLLLAHTQIHLRCQKAAACWLPFVAGSTVAAREVFLMASDTFHLTRGI